MMNSIRMQKIPDILVNKWGAIIRQDTLGNSKATNYVLLYEIGHSGPCSFSQGDCFYLFRITLCCSQYPYVSSRDRGDGSDQIHAPSVEWPRHGDAMKRGGWRMNQVPMHLTR